MLLWLANLLAAYWHPFDVVHYITFRAILTALTSLVVALSFGPLMIRWLKRMQCGQVVREDGPQSHYSKAGTPTMGGGLIMVAILVGTLLWGDLTNRYTYLLLLVTLGFALIGWVDDYKKIALKNTKGLSARRKFLLQSLIAIIAASFLYTTATLPAETELVIPFIKHFMIPLGPFYLLLAYCVIVGSSNAVNLTDGLDGLAILPTVMIAGALGVFAYATGHLHFSEYLMIPYVPNVGECVIFCSSIVGAGLGFLWFNTYPAEVFMGDVGSLGLGAALGTVALIVRQELVLFIMGGIFVLETVSVMLQVGYFKMTGGKRLFRMAPIHHHFELKGWPEPKVIVRFWVITFVLVLIGLATLKLR